MLTLSTKIWLTGLRFWDSFQSTAKKLRTKDEALTTTEWALLVAGAAALAIAVVAVVRDQTTTATKSINVKPINVSPTLVPTSKA